MKAKSLFLILLLMAASIELGAATNDKVASASALVVDRMTCEYRENPMGVDAPHPRFGWTLNSEQRAQHQTAYRILVASNKELLVNNNADMWDSGQITSNQTSQILYAGKPLQSDCRYYWHVQVWNQNGTPSSTSAISFWSTGLLQASDWKAQWIGLDKAVGDDDIKSEQSRLSARMLRREFSLAKPVKRASAFVCGLGLFEWYINGQKIGDQVLAPALSEYNKRAYYMCFDVTQNLCQGNNAIGVLLGNGRYFAPRLNKGTRTYGFPKLMLQVNIEYADGSRSTICSDTNWKLTTDGPILANNEYDGETYDARKEQAAWIEPGFVDTNWRQAQRVDAPGEHIVAQPSEPIKIMQTITPVALTEPQPGLYIFDMGQNMVGWAQLRVQGTAGTRVQLRFAETVKKDSTLFLDNIRTAKVTDTYILNGRGVETWEPKFTYHGFRYVEMQGYPGKPELTAITGKVVHDALRPVGAFSCSSPVLNNIYEKAIWGTRGNYRSIPTDCPQRDERQGWLGDRSMESRGESYLFDVAAFYNKWLVDIQDATDERGSIPDVAPSYWPTYSDNTTWPGSYIIIAGMLYDQYHDLTTLRRHYPTMQKWIGHMRQYIDNGVMTRDTYGDWCVPPHDRTLIHTTDARQTTAGDLIATAYFYHELKLMQRFAALLGKSEDAHHYGAEADKMKAAFNDRFLTPSPLQYGNNSQTSSVLALVFGLVPDEHRNIIMGNLVEKIMGESEGHVGTGLIGCQWLNRVLSENGRPDIAYTIATQTTYPSLGYMIEHNATTIWELWNGDTGDPGMNSHNHVMLIGDLVVWFHEWLAGIKSDPAQPAFSHLIMKPQVVAGLDDVKASLASLNGLISSEWTMKAGAFHWDLRIPPNVTATVAIPADKESVITETGKPVATVAGVRFLRREQDRMIYEIASGRYSFRSSSYHVPAAESYVSNPVITPQDRTVSIPQNLTVTMTCKTPGAAIHYTLDGSEPDQRAPIYAAPIKIAERTILKAKAFKPGLHAGATQECTYDFIDPKINGAQWSLYEGAFETLPDFTKLTPKKSGRSIQIDLAGLDLPYENFAMTFTSNWVLVEGGEYTVSISSNDGSQLFIDDRLVINNDGLHGALDKSTKIRLSAGKHRIKATYFQAGGSKVLKVFYRRSSASWQTIPGSMLQFE
jgi:alpha-L-rhamnosidase